MRKAILWPAFLAISFLCQAQSFQIEGLRKQIQEHPQQDTFRVNRLNEICNTYYPVISIEEMEKFATEALLLARQLNYTKGVGYALLVNARVANMKRNTKEAKTMLQQADSIAKKTGDQVLQWRVLTRYSGLTTDLRLQIQEILKAEAFAQQINNIEFIARSQNFISGIYLSLGYYALAMEYGIKGMKSAELLNDPNLLYSVYDNISYIYSLIGEYDKSNMILQKQPALIRQLGFSGRPLANLYNALGENSRFAKKHLEAIGYYNQAIATTNNTGDSAMAKSNLADVYVSMDSLSLAFEYAFEAMAGFKKANRPEFESWGQSILARAYLKKNMPDSALYFARLGYNGAKETGNMEDMRSTSKTLADAYALKNDFKNAYTHHLLYSGYRDSLSGAEVKNKTTVLEHNYEMEKKEDQIALLGQQKKAQRNFLLSVSIILGLIVISAIGMLRSIHQKKKANKLLEQQKQEIDDKARELSAQKDNIELLGEIGRKITSSLSVETIISTAYDNVNSLMDASVFGIGIYNDSLKRLEFPATYENGEALPFYVNSIEDKNRFGPLCFNSGKEIIIGDMEKEYKDHVEEVLTPHEGNQPVSIIFLPLTAKGKKSGVITVQSFQQNAYTDYHLYMLRNIAIYTAIALENAESYEELNHTISSLKSTQAQLIHSEKMASLGELTAGIAHEIQNPLNFVNNFAEINSELIAEMKQELQNGNIEQAGEIAGNIFENEQKIIFHGKRADTIVKGMLQHSRSSSGVKEPANLNAIADEYLRLAYHGLRAKDKLFNATTKTNFDETIGKINIVPQDIGRVILNLITNAFYSVSEKKKQQHNGYEPVVAVSTKKTNGKVMVSVKDNGNGIPQKVLDKIFQPFFTTKPAGRGTGLGLSMSYDIITKVHEGELKVVTNEGEGAEFIIILPI